VSLLQDGIRLDACGEDAFVVGVAFEQVFVDALQAWTGDLRPTGVVEEDGRSIKGRELASDNGWIESHTKLLQKGWWIVL